VSRSAGLLEGEDAEASATEEGEDAEALATEEGEDAEACLDLRLLLSRAREIICGSDVAEIQSQQRIDVRAIN
jgi:hypothetical protein